MASQIEPTVDLKSSPTAERLTLKRLWKDGIRRFVVLEKGWVRTVRDLFRCPERVIRTYLEGDRVAYANPFTFLVINTILSLFLINISGFQEELVGQLGNAAMASPGQMQFQLETMDLMFRNQNLVYLGIIIPFALCLRLFFGKSNLNLAEFAVFALYLVGCAALFGYLFIPIYKIFGLSLTWYLVIANVAQLIFYSYAAIRMFGGNILPVIKTTVSYVVAYLLFMIVVAVLTVVYIIAFGASNFDLGQWNLINATELNAPDIVQNLLEEGKDPNFVLQETALHKAAQNEQADIVELLVAHNADLNAQDYLGRTPLFIAFVYQHWDLGKQLAESGSDIDVASYRGTTPLMLAILNNQPELAVWLLERGADPNGYRNDAREVTPLMMAVDAGDSSLVELLLQKGADPAVENENGEKAIDLTTDKALKSMLAMRRESEVNPLPEG